MKKMYSSRTKYCEYELYDIRDELYFVKSLSVTLFAQRWLALGILQSPCERNAFPH